MQLFVSSLAAWACVSCADGALPADTADAPPPQAAQLTFQVSSEVTRTPAESIAVAVVMTNAGAAPARVLASQYCPVLFQLRRPSDSVGRAVWDGRERIICPARGWEIRLRPGQAETLRFARAVRDVLGDSLPGGRYLVTAVFDAGRETYTRAAGEVVLRRP